MTVCETICPLPKQPGTAIALGYFDGVHLGHRAVLGAAVHYAKARGLQPAAFTFALPENGGFKGKRILTATEKQRRVANLGIAYYLQPPFEVFRALSPEQFVFDVLQNTFAAKAVFCGDNFTFGKNKAGNVAILKALCAQADIEVVLVPMAQYHGETVSSTRIRAALAAGDIPAVNAMLGQDYTIQFPVRHGKKLGRTFGCPTINQIYPEGMQLPKSGVYITQLVLADGTCLPGATGLGNRPTVDGSNAITCETFLPGFSGDLYDDAPTLRFCRFLKPTVKFNSTEELAAYINSAAESALAYFAAGEQL